MSTRKVLQYWYVPWLFAFWVMAITPNVYYDTTATAQVAIPTAASLPAIVAGQVTVTDTAIITPHDTIPRFKGTTISSDTTFDQPQHHTNIEVMAGATLTVKAQVWVSTITVFQGGTLSLEPGAELIFNGDIPDQAGGQFGLGVINIGTFKARGTAVAPWSYNGQEYAWDVNYDVKLIGEGRAHTMSIGMGIYDLEYVHFDRMGRTKVEPVQPVVNQIGRYAVHVHRGHGEVSRFKGCLFTDFLKWALALHDTRQPHVVEECVAVGEGASSPVNGAGFVTEMGTEYGSTFRRNLATRIHGISRKTTSGDNAFTGDGFWFAGIGGITVEDNVAHDCVNGFVPFAQVLPNTLDVNGVIMTKAQLIPTSWKNNKSELCAIAGIDHYSAGQDWWFENHTMDRCRDGILFHAARAQLRNCVITNCDMAHRNFSYSGSLWFEGGRIENCRVGINSTFALVDVRNVEFVNNGVDLDLGLIRGNCDINIESATTVPKIYFGIGLVPDELIEFPGARLLKHGGKTYELRDRLEFADLQFPDRGTVIDEPCTVQRAWDEFNLGVKGRVPLQRDAAIYLPQVTDRGGVSQPLMLEVVPPERPPIAKIWRTVHTAPNKVMWSRAPQKDGDQIQFYRDGVKVWNNPITHSRPGIGMNLEGVKELRMELYRDGQVVSTDTKLLDGSPDPEPDPDEQRLIELRARRDQITAELQVLAARTAELNTELAAVQAEIAELEQ